MTVLTNDHRLGHYLAQVTLLEAEGPGDSKYEFTGTWIIDPDEDLRSGEPDADCGAVWAVAVTQKQRFAVHVAHCNGGWDARLDDCETLEEAAELLPDDIAVELISRVTGVRKLDI